MTHLRWAAALAALGLFAPALPAQGVFFPDPYGPGFVGRGGALSINSRHGHTHFSLALGFGGYDYGWSRYGYYPAGGPVTVVYVQPPPTVVVAPPPDRDALADQALALFQRRVREDPRYEPPPDDRDVRPPPARVPPPMPPADQPKPPPPKPPPPPPKPPEPLKPPPEPPGPLDDPAAENARLVELGRAAFADGEYGRAALRFRQAVAVAPKQPLAHFALGQALFALGKYHDAVDALHDGLALQPDWPSWKFRPADMYGPNAADYADHLKALEDARDRLPADPVLLFLDAYQLWFAGRRDDARPLFRKVLPDDGAAGLFLRAGGAV
jgi:tetratricopeptide (TPR) repeat protein